MNMQEWIGAAILGMFALVSLYRLARQRTISKNLLVLCGITALSAFVLLGIYPTVIRYSGIVIQLADATEALANANETAGVDTGFDDQRIELNGRELFITKDGLDQPASDEDRIINQKYFFSIDRPVTGSGFSYRESTALEYAKEMYGNCASLMADDPNFSDARVFRIVSSQNVRIRTDINSYKGERVSPEEYREARRIYTNNSGEKPPDIANMAAFVAELCAGDDELENVEKNAEKAEADRQWFETLNVGSELAIVVFDKKRFETILTARHRGRRIPATALNFLLASGGTLPRVDVPDVRQTDVSKDNSVWAFHIRSKFNKVEVNGEISDVLQMEHYRFYVLNDAYIYQITLTLLHTPDQPPETWDDLERFLHSLRVVKRL